MKLFLLARCKHQLIKFRITPQRIKILIALSANSQFGLEIKRPSQGFERRIDRTQSGSGRGQTIMDVRSLRLALERALKKFLRGNVLPAIQLNDSAIVERVGVSRRRHIRA